MATKFALYAEGTIFKVKVTDCTNGKAFDRKQIESQKIVFYKQDGTRFTEDAELVEDPENPSESYIEFQDTGESILDQIGSWQYAGEITTVNELTAQTSERFSFWVV